MTPFGRPVDPDVNSTLAIVSAVHAVARRVHRRRRRRLQVVERGRRQRRGRRRRHDELGVGRERLLQCALEERALGGEHQPGLHPVEDLPERAELGGLQRVGRCDRRVGHADVHRGQRQQPVLDAVARQDHDRAIARELTSDEALREPADLCERLGKRDGAPAGDRVRGLARRRRRPLRQEHPIGRHGRPVLEPIGDAHGVGPERRRRLHVDDAVAASPDCRRRCRRCEPAARGVPGALPVISRTGATVAAAARLASNARNVEPSRASRSSSGAGVQRSPCSRWKAATRS